LEEALTHRSYQFEKGETVSNERLEFLGDSVLGLIATEELYRRFPRASEGDLTRLKSRLVNGGMLAQQSEKLGLGAFLMLGNGELKSGGRRRASILANAFEALLGALFLDGGLDAVRRFLSRTLLKDVDDLLSGKSSLNFKSLVLEYFQAVRKVKPTYRIVKEDGPEHRKIFTVEVRIGERLLATGKGPSKKRAEQDAARHAAVELGLTPGQNE
jgi:ribonuclease-3